MNISWIELILVTLIQISSMFSSGWVLISFLGLSFKSIPIVSVSALGTQAIC